MMTSANSRSIFDMCLNDEALIGLKEVNPVLKQPVNTEPASHGMYDCRCRLVSVTKTVALIYCLFET